MIRRLVNRWRRFWDWEAPRKLKVTPIGRMYLVITIGIGLGALNTGNNLLYLLLGFLLSLIVASGVLSERSLRHLRIRRILPESAYAGEAMVLRYEVYRTQGWSFALTLTEETGLPDALAFVPLVAETPVTVRASPMATQRGPTRLSRISVTTNYPLGLFAKTRRFERPDTVLVFPRRGFSCAPPAEDRSSQAGDAGNPRRKDGTGELLGLSELNPGEDARRLHWKKSAAAGRWLKVERAREERKQFQLALSTQEPGPGLERACEELAAQARKLLEQGHEVGLKTPTDTLRPQYGGAQERRIMSALAWAGFPRPAPGGSQP